MADTLKLSILTPEKELYSGDISELSTETTEGDIAILPDHMPMITMLKPTVTTFTTTDGKKLSAFTGSGLLKVGDGSLSLMCEVSEWPADIDKERAEEARKRAEERLKEAKGTDTERAELSLMRAIGRLKAVEK